MSGTCALVVPWHVSGFGYATEKKKKNLKIMFSVFPKCYIYIAMSKYIYFL